MFCSVCRPPMLVLHVLRPALLRLFRVSYQLLLLRTPGCPLFLDRVRRLALASSSGPRLMLLRQLLVRMLPLPCSMEHLVSDPYPGTGGARGLRLPHHTRRLQHRSLGVEQDPPSQTIHHLPPALPVTHRLLLLTTSPTTRNATGR